MHAIFFNGFFLGYFLIFLGHNFAFFSREGLFFSRAQFCCFFLGHNLFSRAVFQDFFSASLKTSRAEYWKFSRAQFFFSRVKKKHCPGGLIWSLAVVHLPTRKLSWIQKHTLKSTFFDSKNILYSGWMVGCGGWNLEFEKNILLGKC